MKNILLPIVLSAWVVTSKAQSIAPEVIASAGGSDNIQLNWTLGEVMIDTYNNGSNILTQGFHQTNLTLVGLEETNPLDLDVNVYPNPTSDRVVISVNGNEHDLSVELFDMNGKLILTKAMKADEQQTQLEMSTLATSYYLLNIHSEDGSYSSSYKIQRTNK